MADQSQHWSQAARAYESEYVDPYRADVRNPLWSALKRLSNTRRKTAADLGCGIGPLLPTLAQRFHRVVGVDFAPGMIERARERCRGLANVEILQRDLTDLAPLHGQVDVALAINSLVMPGLGDIEAALSEIRASLKPRGICLGIVPGMDAVHYLTMLLVDRARSAGMPTAAARKNAAYHAEHSDYDFAFGQYRHGGLEQHFWQPFEIRYRLKRAGFSNIRLARVWLSWEQFAVKGDFKGQKPPWDWFFEAHVP
jgi:SAM-dependent methyltransferase